MIQTEIHFMGPQHRYNTKKEDILWGRPSILYEKKYIILGLSIDMMKQEDNNRCLSIDVIKKERHHMGHGYRWKGTYISYPNGLLRSQFLIRNRFSIGRGFTYKYTKQKKKAVNRQLKDH